MQSNNEMNQENSMFDMRKTGAILSRLRRDAELTQAELAEKLGISYQAVSSWERGASMPDIGKLMDLARALNTTVDYILSGEKDEVPQDTPVQDESMPENNERHIHIDIDTDGIRQAVNRQTENTSKEGKNRASGLASLFALAPFLDQKTLDSTALSAEGPIDLAMLAGLAPFLSSQTLDTLADRCDVNSDTALIAGLAPFLSQETVGRLFARCQQAAQGKDQASLCEKKPGNSLRMAIKGCDSDDVLELAQMLADQLDSESICLLIDRCDSEEIPELAETLAGCLDDEAIRRLIDRCDSEMIPELAKAVQDQLNDEHVERLIKRCDSDCMMQLVEVVADHLKGGRAESILRRLQD